MQGQIGNFEVKISPVAAEITRDGESVYIDKKGAAPIYGFRSSVTGEDSAGKLAAEISRSASVGELHVTQDKSGNTRFEITFADRNDPGLEEIKQFLHAAQGKTKLILESDASGNLYSVTDEKKGDRTKLTGKDIRNMEGAIELDILLVIDPRKFMANTRLDVLKEGKSLDLAPRDKEALQEIIALQGPANMATKGKDKTFFQEISAARH